mmetsp:Transcript_18425/g.61692  ORF Transcript_18425/g.61692 Transcript_18425/m.61692 type:complete len:332 (-) Transcript_18425:312-1307(-)
MGGSHHTKRPRMLIEGTMCPPLASSVVTRGSPLLAHGLRAALAPAAANLRLRHEPRRGEGREVHAGGLAVEDELAHRLAAHGSPQDTPAVVPAGDVGALDVPHRAHDGERVGRAWAHARLRHRGLPAEALAQGRECPRAGLHAVRVRVHVPGRVLPGLEPAPVHVLASADAADVNGRVISRVHLEVRAVAVVLADKEGEGLHGLVPPEHEGRAPDARHGHGHAEPVLGQGAPRAHGDRHLWRADRLTVHDDALHTPPATLGVLREHHVLHLADLQRGPEAHRLVHELVAELPRRDLRGAVLVEVIAVSHRVAIQPLADVDGAPRAVPGLHL